MEDRNIPMGVLLTETIRRIPQYLILATALSLASLIACFLLDTTDPGPVIAATFFTVLYIAAPMISSSVRASRGLSSFGAAGRTVLVFCFSWGAIVVALFLATIQLWQGMAATVTNYFSSMVVAGLACATFALIPNRI